MCRKAEQKGRELGNPGGKKMVLELAGGRALLDFDLNSEISQLIAPVPPKQGFLVSLSRIFN